MEWASPKSVAMIQPCGSVPCLSERVAPKASETIPVPDPRFLDQRIPKLVYDGTALT